MEVCYCFCVICKFVISVCGDKLERKSKQEKEGRPSACEHDKQMISIDFSFVMIAGFTRTSRVIPHRLSPVWLFKFLLLQSRSKNLPSLVDWQNIFLYINTNNSLVTASKCGFIIVNCNRISLHFCTMIIGSVVRRRPKPSFLWLLCYLQIFYRLKNKQTNKTLVWGD